MSLSLHSLFSQKKGAVFSFVLLVAVAMLVVGILSVMAAHNKTVTMSPIFTSASYNESYNFTVTNAAGSASISEVRITRDNAFATVVCQVPPASWTCTESVGNTYAEFTGGTIAAGSSQTFNITAVSAAGAANYTFQIRTLDADSGVNTTKFNVTVDAHGPMVGLVNITDGTNVIFGGDVSNRTFFLNNATKGLVFVINVTDNSSGMGQGRVVLYYNVTTVGIANRMIDYRNASLLNVSTFTASNGSYGEVGLYNITLNISSMKSLNGTSIAFQIIANDSVKNFNWSNTSMQDAVSSYNYNFTIDTVAPLFVDVQIANQSLNSATAINTTQTFGSAVEHILNSSLILNVSALVRDDGGAGTIKMEVMNRLGAFMTMDLLTGTNSSSTQTTWNFSQYNVTDLVKGFAGNGLYNLTFRATDNVSNVNNSYNFTIEVDDSPPTASAFTNLTINASAILSIGNTSLDALSVNNGGQINTSFTLRLQTTSNVDNTTRNISVFGNKGKVFNLTYSSGTPSTTAIWNLTITNLTTVNLTQFCDITSADGQQCNFRFNFSDVLGRHNDTINLTIAVDGLAPNVSIVSPVFLTTNYSGTALVNISVNDSVGPLQNVSFRLRNGTTAANIEGYFNATHANVSNVTNWIPLTLNSGNNNQFLAQGYWSATLNLTAQQFADGNYSVEVNATDSSGRQNATVAVTSVIFDSSPPQNITLVNPSAANTFNNAMFNITINVTDRISGLRNVSFRLENNSFNWPWVEGSQVVNALTIDQRFNASQWNLTHFGGVPTNATNGNFTLRLNVTDTAGNQNTSITINFTIDTIAPAVAFFYPLNSRNQSANFTVNITVNESNNNFFAYRWENHTGLTANEGQNFSNWITFYSNAGGANNWNSTFNVTEGTPVDGNYTIKINVTDKAGNSNTSVFIQFLIDRSLPRIAAVSSIANSVQTANFVVNATVNDTYSLNMVLGKLNITNINGTASFRLENASFNSSLVIMNFPVADLANGESNRTNGTFTFSSIANGNYNLRFFVNDTAGNMNSTVVVSNITLDNVAPGVAVSIVNVSPAISGGVGAVGTITLNATVSDNLPLNISVTNWSQRQDVAYGVFYRYENSTHNLSWLPMNTTNFQNQVHNNTGNEHKATFFASNTTATVADGDYSIRINVTDKAGNQNTTQTMSITIQNGGSKVRAVNLTFQGGIWNGFANSSTDSYTFLLNTTTNSTCRYSLDTAVTYYDDMTSTMANNVSKEHRISFGPFRDVAASGHDLYYACKDVSGNFTASEGAAIQFPFGVDTRSRWNVTIPGKTDNNWPNYFQAAVEGSSNNGWSSFVLSTGTLAATSLASTQGGYNATNVLASLLKGTADGNFSRIYAYTASTNSWETFIVGQGGNTFINFTNQTTYWINVTATERLEVN